MYVQGNPQEEECRKLIPKRMADFAVLGPATPKLFSTRQLLLFMCIYCCLLDLKTDAQTLPNEEIDALKKIDAALGIGWDFSVNPCSGERGWQDGGVDPQGLQPFRKVTCGCGSNNSTCHVKEIVLKRCNLAGILPTEFANLTHLTVIDLTRNIINGSINATIAWASLPLINITLQANRISGEIPSELGSISTLLTLHLENNLLRGTIPLAIGRLKNLNRLILSANDFTGELPESLGDLKNLTEFRIDGAGIFGKIPSFMGNWTRLTMLNMRGTALEGPFPPFFSHMKELKELRVTDLKGGGSFPQLKGMDLETLILRSCSISGDIPSYLVNMGGLQNLDLSFNNFTGPVPLLSSVNSIENMYLTNNMLSGPIPDWIERSSKKLDLSFNSFSGKAPADCLRRAQNLFATFSSSEDNSINACLRKDFPCPGKAKNYQLFINCGGKNVNIEGTEYDEDSTEQGPSTFFLSKNQNWAFSSTGDFNYQDVVDKPQEYITTNTSLLNMSNPELYMSARLSPVSLRYYGLCLQNGIYSVKLHFAEIMFTDDQTFSSLGKRLFDVSIQGQKVLKDFNIKKEANGSGRVITKTFPVVVKKSTLEIHLQWAGKGSTDIPWRGVYGPLISAISVRPDFKPDLEKLPLGAILGIVAASSVLIMLIILCLWYFLIEMHKESNESERLKLLTCYFSLRQIKSATRNFSCANKIGQGGFGPVYKGVLSDGSVIAVKQLSSYSKQGNREFVNEIGLISALHHPNLVKLFGCCIEGNQLLLIYEYMENNNLARALFGPEGMTLKMDWQRRRKICLDIARGLAYLHEESMLKIVHRDIKATNILLDKGLNAKISDFGLARLDEEENTHISTRIAGTVGYIAPEYATRGHLTDKADVYSFGIVMLEIISGKSNTSYRPEEESVYLLDWAYVLKEQGNLLELVDLQLGLNYPKEEALLLLNLTLQCTNISPTLRPTMSTVVSMLEGQMPDQIIPLNLLNSGVEELGYGSFENLSHCSSSNAISMEIPLADSSQSASSNRGALGALYSYEI